MEIKINNYFFVSNEFFIAVWFRTLREWLKKSKLEDKSNEIKIMQKTSERTELSKSKYQRLRRDV